MSDEHPWPEWSHPYLPKIPDATNWVAIASETIDGMKTTRKKPRMGHTFTKKIHVVCKKCNETWMGDIEDETKYFLLPIIRGEKTTLDHGDRIRLATWLTLRFFVFDNEKDALPISTKKDLTAFKERRVIPDRMKIWIARHNEFDWSAAAWNRGITMSFGPRPPAVMPPKNIETIAFGIGHIFSLMCLSLVEGLNLEINNPFTPQLWPSDLSTLEWPPPLMPTGGIREIANVIDDLGAVLNFQWAAVSGA